MFRFRAGHLIAAVAWTAESHALGRVGRFLAAENDDEQLRRAIKLSKTLNHAPITVGDSDDNSGSREEPRGRKRTQAEAAAGSGGVDGATDATAAETDAAQHKEDVDEAAKELEAVRKAQHERFMAQRGRSNPQQEPAATASTDTGKSAGKGSVAASAGTRTAAGSLPAAASSESQPSGRANRVHTLADYRRS